MTLTELKAVTSAYSSFSTIKDCDLPDYYKEIFPHYCECGAEMIMTEPGHTQLQCCNPTCWVKMGHRLAYFISFLGYKGFGEQSCLALLRETHNQLRFRSFLAVFFLTDTELSTALSEHYVGLFNEIRDDLNSRAVYFSDAIAALGIPNIGSKSALFDVVKSPVVLADYVLHKKTDLLCNMAGIQAPITRFQLSSFRVDILTLMKDIMPNILDTPRGEVFVAITGKVSVNGKTYSRYEFIALCESILDNNGVQLYKIVETKAESKLQYVIADAPSNSEKYRLGLRLNNLISADDFYKELLAQSGKLEKGVVHDG